jgi:hypothetical protein
MILQEVSAGMLGTEGPIEKKRKAAIEQQAMKLRMTAATVQAVAAFGELSKNVPAGKMDEAISQFEATVGLPGVGDLLRATKSKGVDVGELSGWLAEVPEAGPFLSSMLQAGLMTPEDAVDFTTEFLGDRLKARTAVETAVVTQQALIPGKVDEAAALAAIKTPEPTALQQDLEAAGLEPGSPAFRAAILASRTKPQVSIREGKPFGQAKAEERQSAAIETIGMAAGTKVATQSMAELLAAGVDTGATQGGRMLLKAFAADVGMDIDADALGKQEEFDRLSKDITLNSMQRFKGAMSERELDFGVNTVANIGKSEEGNIRGLAALRAGSEIALENAGRLAEAGSAEEVRKVEIEIAKRSADHIKARTAEIETEIRAQIAAARAGVSAVTVDSVNAMDPAELRSMANRLGNDGLAKLGQDVLQAIIEKLDEPPQ